MSLDQLKDQVTQLAPQEQRELIAYLISLQTGRDDGFKKQLAQKIDDSDPTHWIELDDLRRRFSE
ncbi:MAG: hypothetical protein HYY23_16555 [Verrucomicrobia bacterium]|nr:hypothetical protein [Verrucomicrobiota bacterium]